MKEEIKYPYIGKSNQGNNYLVVSGNAIYSFISKSWMVDYNGGFAPMENITREYLANTCGEIQSTEHADFIIELVELHGFSVLGRCLIDIGIVTHFAIYDGELKLHSNNYYNAIKSYRLKQITIPLPPKHLVETETPKPSTVSVSFAVNYNEPLSYRIIGNGDFYDEYTTITPVDEKTEGDSDGWPQAGDEVEFPSGKGTLVVSKPDEQGIVIVESLDSDLGSVYKRVSLKALKKPKTPEEELRDDIIELTLKHMENTSHPVEANAYYLFSDLISKYSIKPQ